MRVPGVAPSLGSEFVMLAVVGAASVTFAAGINSSLQLAAAPVMRGRVMALYSVVFLGSTPIGGPLIGAIIAVSDPRSGLAVGGASCLLAAAAGLWLVRRYRRADDRAQPGQPIVSCTDDDPASQPASAIGTR